jgi:ADP-ribosylglycohydrolase
MNNKICGSLIGFYIGDALAMPVHWYYDLSRLKSDFGRISRYEAPKVEISSLFPYQLLIFVFIR